MKKAIVLLAAGFMFTFCNPSQQTDQTVADSSRMGDATTVDTTSTMTDTSGHSMPDTTNRPDSTRN